MKVWKFDQLSAAACLLSIGPPYMVFLLERPTTVAKFLNSSSGWCRWQSVLTTSFKQAPLSYEHAFRICQKLEHVQSTLSLFLHIFLLNFGFSWPADFLLLCLLIRHLSPSCGWIATQMLPCDLATLGGRSIVHILSSGDTRGCLPQAGISR